MVKVSSNFQLLKKSPWSSDNKLFKFLPMQKHIHYPPQNPLLGTKVQSKEEDKAAASDPTSRAFFHLFTRTLVLWALSCPVRTQLSQATMLQGSPSHTDRSHQAHQVTIQLRSWVFWSRNRPSQQCLVWILTHRAHKPLKCYCLMSINLDIFSMQ